MPLLEQHPGRRVDTVDKEAQNSDSAEARRRMGLDRGGSGKRGTEEGEDQLPCATQRARALS